MEKSEVYDLFKAFGYFSTNKPIFHHACETYSEIPSNISTMVGTISIKNKNDAVFYLSRRGLTPELVAHLRVAHAHHQH